MIKQIQLFLGPARVRVLILLLGVTGLVSLVLRAFDDGTGWAVTGQSLMVVVFVAGAVIIIGGRLTPFERGRWAGILAPALGLVILGLTVLVQLQLVLFGAALGWVLAALLLFRPRLPSAYRQAVRHLHKGEYAEAVKQMDAVIKDDPQNENYYRFRAEVLRMWGKLGRARKDYETMIQLVPDSAVGYNGLAEVNLQSGDYDAARQAALTAYELMPDEWVAAYNLGMIEDRLGEAEDAITHLQTALSLNVPDVRHRLLIHLYLARAYRRLGRDEAAAQAIEQVKRHRGGLEEWQNLLSHEQASVLRDVLQPDVELAQQLVMGEVGAEALE